MKKTLSAFLIFICVTGYGQKNQTVITQDITNFWNAYDQIITIKDSLKKIEIIQTQYIDKGTAGLKDIMKARRYSAAEYIKVIDQYPVFWKSIRPNTLKANFYAGEIEKGINKFRSIYPGSKPAKVYFTIGAFRTNGTTIEDKVLIGSEIAMGDSKTATNEFRENLSHLPSYFSGNPINNIVFLNVHEYIHTQQKTTIGNTLLAQTIIEGVAEFIATLALNTNSPNDQITYGKINDEKIKTAYVKEMFSTNFDNWIWNNTDNAFKMRDLGYYVGYAICEKYYTLAKNKNQAIKTMIELDYNDPDKLTSFVEATHYFSKPLLVYKNEYEASRPSITKIEPFENKIQDADTNMKKITIFFSQPMNKRSGDFDIGPLGDKNVMWLEKRIGFSEDGMSYSFEVKPLTPGKQYQLLITDYFLNGSGIPLKPYLIDIKTKNK